MSQNEEDITLGSALLVRRLELQQDQEAAAEQMAVSVTTYGFWERDARTPRTGRLASVAEYLDVDHRQMARLVANTMREKEQRRQNAL